MKMFNGIEQWHQKFNIWGTTKSIERRRIVSVRKSKTGFADVYVKFSQEDSMVAKASIIKNYAKADAAGKVDMYS